MKQDIPGLLQKVRALGIEEHRIDDDELVISTVFQHNLSAYDAAYLALAIQANAILATNDRQLARAADAVNVKLRTVLVRSQITQ